MKLMEGDIAHADKNSGKRVSRKVVGKISKKFEF
jgi:hypothetical protein